MEPRLQGVESCTHEVASCGARAGTTFHVQVCGLCWARLPDGRILHVKDAARLHHTKDESWYSGCASRHIGCTQKLGYSIVGPKIMATATVFTVRLGFTGVTPTALVEKGRNHVTMLTGNLAFPTPTPTLASITAACNALDVANQAFDFNRGKVEKQTRDTAFTALKDLIRELGGYVQANCNGDKDLILSTGFDTRRPNDPVGPLNAPQNLRVLVAAYPGRLDVRWNGVRGRLLYQLYMTAIDPLDPIGWKLLLQSSKNRHTIDDLQSNTTYTFRTVALGTAGPSPVSDIASAKAA